MTNLWRAHIRPDGNPAAAYRFCVDRDIVGFGWTVGPAVSLTRPQYEALASLEYEPPSKHNRGWIGALNAIDTHMHKGDLCWMSHPDGRRFHIGRIAGQWEYRSSPEYVEVDIVNVRPCVWFQHDRSPAGVSWRRGRTLQRVGDRGALRASVELYNRLAALRP